MWNIKKWFKSEKKVSLPEEHWKKNHWDKKHVMTGKSLCEFQGHLWVSSKENGRLKAVCSRCDKEFWVDSEGTIS